MHGTDRTLRPELGRGGVQTHTQHLDGSTRPTSPADPLSVQPTLREAFIAGARVWEPNIDIDPAAFDRWLESQ
jgi:hypothetical protein